MTTPIKIGIIGDFNPDNPTHTATNDGLQHAARALPDLTLTATWLPTDEPHSFSEFHGLLCSPGSPYKSLEGALEGIRHAREEGIPFLGTCGGSQHLVLEYARNVMGFREAAHAESDPYASCLFIAPLSCSLVGKIMEVHVEPASRAAEIYGRTTVSERYYCNFGLNPAYQDELKRAGLVVSGSDHAGEARIMELPRHPFFLGSLFVPQANSTEEKPHPIVLELLRAAAKRSTSKSHIAMSVL
jgi:CTP synthase (UTP-ammonia lyase)